MVNFVFEKTSHQSVIAISDRMPYISTYVIIIGVYLIFHPFYRIILPIIHLLVQYNTFHELGLVVQIHLAFVCVFDMSANRLPEARIDLIDVLDFIHQLLFVVVHLTGEDNTPPAVMYMDLTPYFCHMIIQSNRFYIYFFRKIFHRLLQVKVKGFNIILLEL